MAIPQPSKPGKPDNTPPAKLSKTEGPGKKLYAWLEKRIEKAGTDKREADGLKLIGQYVFGNPQIELADLPSEIIQAAQAAFLLLDSNLKPIAKPYLPAELLPSGEAPAAEDKPASPKPKKATEEDQEDTPESVPAPAAKATKANKSPVEAEDDSEEEDEAKSTPAKPTKSTKVKKSVDDEEDSEEEDARPSKSKKDSSPVMVPVPVSTDKSDRLSDEEVQKQFEVVTDDKPDPQPVGRKLVTTSSPARKRGPAWVVPVVVLVLGGGALAGGIYLADKYLSTQHSSPQAKGPSQDTPTTPNPPPRTSTPTPKPPPKKIDVTPTPTPDPTPDPKTPGPMNPMPVPSDRKAAEKLIPFAELTLKLATGETVTAKKDGALPPGDWTITQILVLGDKLPPEFVDEVLRPAIADLRSLTHLNARFGTNVKLTEDQVVQLGKLPLTTTLTSLVARFELTTRTLDALSRITNLNELACDATTADDALLKRLTELPNLAGLSLGALGKSGQVSAAGVTEVVAKLPIFSLALDHSPVVDRAFLQKLPTMPKVRYVNFYGCNIGNDDLKELTHCPHLEVVGLGGTKVTDAGLVHLAKMPKLLVLMLINNGITDRGLEYLTKITGLQRLQLGGTKVTKVGVEKLAKVLPQCKIEWDGGVIEPKDPERFGAEQLNPFMHLTVKLASGGKWVTVDKGERLPNEPFVVVRVEFREKPTEKFIDEVLLPTVANFGSLEGIVWPWMDRVLSEDQLARLSNLPLAKTLTELGVAIDLTARTLDLLRRFPKLSGLKCIATTADDALLKRLSELPNLTGLAIAGMGQSKRVSAQGLESITKLNLTDLGLYSCTIVNQKFAELLSKMPKLRSVAFYGSSITDDDLREFAQCPELKLNVSETGITDAGIARLEKGTGPREVVLVETKVTERGVKKLQAARRDLKITWGTWNNNMVIEPTKKHSPVGLHPLRGFDPPYAGHVERRARQTPGASLGSAYFFFGSSFLGSASGGRAALINCPLLPL